MTVDHDSRRAIPHLAGLRMVAFFEALKGILVLLAGLGLLSLLHKDVGEQAERIVRHLHMNPAHHRSVRVFVDAAAKVTDKRLWALAAGALAYTIVRFVEAYGLWHARIWAEWFALLSGCLYLPWEIFELLNRATLIRWSIFLINLAIVIYMAYVRFSDRMAERKHEKSLMDT